MALIKCTECGNEVSNKATACPKCGAPIEQKETPKVEEPKIVQPQQIKKKSKTWIWMMIITIIVIILSLIVVVIVKNNPNSIPGIKIEVNTPKPIVVTSRADNSKSGLLKLRTTVYATVQNQGGDGNVLVLFHVYQDGNDYERSKSIFLIANGSQDLDATFNEVKLLGGDITYQVDVKAE